MYKGGSLIKIDTHGDIHINPYQETFMKHKNDGDGEVTQQLKAHTVFTE